MTNSIRATVFTACLAILAAHDDELFAAGVTDSALPAYLPERTVTAEISSIGDDAMRPLMDAWWAEFHKRQSGVRQGARWEAHWAYVAPRRPAVPAATAPADPEPSTSPTNATVRDTTNPAS